MDYEKAFFEMASAVLRIAGEYVNADVARTVCDFIEKIDDQEAAIRFAKKLLKESHHHTTLNWAEDFLEKKAPKSVEPTKKPEAIEVPGKGCLFPGTGTG